VSRAFKTPSVISHLIRLSSPTRPVKTPALTPYGASTTVVAA
jgi:hypothetical protein